MRHRLSELTRTEAQARASAGALCLLPVGALEQHGEHLPLGTDCFLAEAVACRAAAIATRDVVVAPSVWAGLSPHHVALGPTVTLEPELLIGLTRALVRELRRTFDAVVLVNGHGGNRGWLGALALQERCVAVSYWELVDPDLMLELFPADLGSVGHAGQVETSAMLAVAAELVAAPGPTFEPIVRQHDPLLLPDMGKSGVLGDPSAADEGRGERFASAAAATLARLIDTHHEEEP